MRRILGHVKVTSFVELHNASLHVSPTSQRPNHTLFTSVSRIRAECKRKRKTKNKLDKRNADRRLATRVGADAKDSVALNHAA